MPYCATVDPAANPLFEIFTQPNTTLPAPNHFYMINATLSTLRDHTKVSESTFHTRSKKMQRTLRGHSLHCTMGKLKIGAKSRKL